jgi:hypothetical protein
LCTGRAKILVKRKFARWPTFVAPEQMVHIDWFIGYGHDDATLDEILQFAGIPREVILQQRLDSSVHLRY